MKHPPNQKCCSLVALLGNVQPIRQTCQKGRHYLVVHGETSFETSEEEEMHRDEVSGL